MYDLACGDDTRRNASYSWLGEIRLTYPNPSFTVAVTAEADGRRPYCVLTVGLHPGSKPGYVRALMSWPLLAERLASYMFDGKKRYG